MSTSSSSSVFLLISLHALAGISGLGATVIQCILAELCEMFLCIKTFGVKTFLNWSDWAESVLLLMQTEWHERLPTVINSNSAALGIRHSV